MPRAALRLPVRPAIAVTGIVALLTVLAIRDETPLPPRPPLPDVTVTVVAGGLGTEADGSGPFTWVTEPSATIRAYNNTSTPLLVDVRFLLASPPCDVEGRTTTVWYLGEAVHVARTAADRSEPISVEVVVLQPSTATHVQLETDGRHCTPNPADQRTFYLMVRDLQAVLR